MFLYASILATVIAIYVIVRAIFPLKTHWGNKLALSIITGIAAYKFHLFYLLEGHNFFTPNLPAELVWSGCWLFCAVFAFALLLLAADILRLPLYLLLQYTSLNPSRLRRRRHNNRINLALLLTALGVTAWGTWCGIKAPEVRAINLTIDCMPSDTAPIRLVQLTDLHADSTKGAEFYQDIVRRTNELQPDVVVITGDFADGSVRDCGSALTPLRELDAPMGVYAVTGNHDYFWGTSGWLGYLKALGVEFIDGKCEMLSVALEGGVRKELCLIGLHDPMVRRTGLKTPTIGELASPRGEYKRSYPVVLLSHQPRVADTAAGYDIDLQLSGHTHGGQFPGLQQLVARFNNGYACGLYQVGRMQLYVSPGTSLWTPICLRLGVPSEITVINLCPADKK